MNKRF